MEPEQQTVVELHDWEVLPAPENDMALPTPPIYPEKLIHYDAFDGDSEQGIIRSDHFSLRRNEVSDSVHDLVSEQGDSVHSDNPGWIDPAFEVSPFQRRISADFWSDSSCEDHKFSDSEFQTEFDTVENVRLDYEEISPIGNEASGTEKTETVDVETAQPPQSNGDGVNSVKPMVWWNLPMQLIKYCLFKASPVWSVSLAAAVMGFVILGRRLYKMKRKSLSLQLKVTVDEKKVSQFGTRAARLNEAFSVARRVPMIRPSLPAAGVTPSWSMTSLR